MTRIKPGNILMVANFPSDTAYAWWLMEHFWKTLSIEFEKNSNSAYLAYPKITTISQNIHASNIKPVELTVPFKSIKQLVQTYLFVKKNNISCIYFTDKPFFKFQYGLLRLFGVKSIVTHDHTPGDRPPIQGLKGTFKAFRNSFTWFTANHVFCVSELMRQRNISNARVPPDKCTVIQNGINPVNCQNDKIEVLRQELNIQPSTCVVITTGRAAPYKRFDFIIETANNLFSLHPKADVTFLLVGDGPSMSSLKAMISTLGLKDSVQLLGFRKDIHDLLCISNIAFHASLGEGFSLSIIEYMSAGLPVLVPDIPSVKQAIENNINGFIYQKTKPENAASYIYELAVNNEQRMSMGSQAKRYADNIYTLDRCTREFITAFKNAYSLEL